MAQYKVPQDVEADDKLLGPFTFRQFIYLIIAAGFIALAWALFQVFPLLVIIPVPIILFFGALALPLKKDQPMETYLAAIVSFHLKPRNRFWDPGQPESTIRITAPKKVEVSRTKDISQDEATHRLSFLAEIVDSEGHAIKTSPLSPIKDEIYAEANSTQDMFDASATNNLSQAIQNEDNSRHAAAVQQMKNAIETAETIHNTDASIRKFGAPAAVAQPVPASAASVVVNPIAPPAQPTPAYPNTPPPAVAPPNVQADQPQPAAPPVVDTPTAPNPAIVDLANNNDFSVETIAKEAKRIEQNHDGEVYIALH